MAAEFLDGGSEASATSHTLDLTGETPGHDVLVAIVSGATAILAGTSATAGWVQVQYLVDQHGAAVYRLPGELNTGAALPPLTITHNAARVMSWAAVEAPIDGAPVVAGASYGGATGNTITTTNFTVNAHDECLIFLCVTSGFPASGDNSVTWPSGWTGYGSSGNSATPVVTQEVAQVFVGGAEDPNVNNTAVEVATDEVNGVVTRFVLAFNHDNEVPEEPGEPEPGAPDVLAELISAEATTHNLSIPGATAGRTVVVVATAAATMTLSGPSVTAGWVVDDSEVNNAGTYTFRLPGGSNPGGTLSLTVTMPAGRALAAVALEADIVGGLVGADVREAGRNSSEWQSDPVTTSGVVPLIISVWAASGTALSAGDNLTAHGQGFTALADSGHSTGSSFEDSRVWLGYDLDRQLTNQIIGVSFANNPGSVPVAAGVLLYNVAAPSQVAADAGPDRSGAADFPVALNGSGSSGTGLTYAWTQTAGPTVALTGASTATPTFTPTEPGSYTFQLQVGDGTDSDTDTVTVTVLATYTALEATRTGVTNSQWWDGVGVTSGIPGFPRSTFYAPGETAQFSADYDDDFEVRIFRFGAYGNQNARLVATIQGTPTAQPAATIIPNSNGAHTCKAWSVNAEWEIPDDQPPGWYAVLFVDAGVAFGQCIFVVTDEANPRPILVTSSDPTYMQAYSNFGGTSSPLGGANVYGSGTGVGNINDRAYASTLDKPVTTRDNVPQTHWGNGEAPVIRFLERMGLDVGYATKEQIQNNPEILDGRQMVLSVGHDEYISQVVHDKFREISEGGTTIVSFSANDWFWRIIPGSEAGPGTPGDMRVMWCRKDTMGGPTGSGHSAGVPFDGAANWTGTWRDTRWANRDPESDLWGDHFIANGIRSDNLRVPAAFKATPMWRGCAGIQALGTGQEYVFTGGPLGMEWDMPRESDELKMVPLSLTTIDLTQGGAADENGQNYNMPGTYDHSIQVGYRIVDGERAGTVVNFSTTQWGWLLDAFHLRGSSSVDVNAQQGTLNLLADLGAEPVPSMVTAAGLAVPTPVADFDAAYDLVDTLTTDEADTLGITDAVLVEVEEVDPGEEDVERTLAETVGITDAVSVVIESSQVAAPAGTVSSAGWTVQGSAGSAHASLADVSDSSYVRASAGAAAVVLDLGDVDTPATDEGHQLRVRVRAAAGAPTLQVQLRQGSTAIATWTVTPSQVDAWEDVTLSLSTGEAAAITDYTALRVALITA